MADDQKKQLDDYYTRWSAKPGPKTLEPLLNALDPTIDRAMRSFGFAGGPNIRSTARLHAIKVLDRFDPAKASLDTFMFNELKRLRRLGTRQQHAIPMPEQAALDLRNINNAEEELRLEKGREPTSEELADHARLSSRRIQRIRSLYGIPTITEAALATPGGGVEMPGTEMMDTEQLWADAVYSGLDPIDKKIMDWSMGRHGQPRLSKTEMARRLGVSVSAVTQRAARVAKKLEEGAEYAVL